MHTGLIEAIQSADVLKFLLEIKDMSMETVCVIESTQGPILNLLYRHNMLEVADVAIDKGANINAQSALGWGILHYVAAKGYPDQIRKLIKQGANVNLQTREGFTALHMACYHDKFDNIKLLLDLGADVSICDERGNDVLYFSNMSSSKKSVELIESAMLSGKGV